MFDITKTTPEKMGEMISSLMVDNEYLRGELHAARARLAGTSEAPVCGNADQGKAQIRDSI